MNDPLKDFVEQHRAEFDDLEAPALKLDELKVKIKTRSLAQKRRFLILPVNKWLVAASILVTLTCGWLFLYTGNENMPVAQLAQRGQSNAADMENVGGSDKTNNPQHEEIPAVQPLVEKNTHRNARSVQMVKRPVEERYARLKDSASASSRLLAILEIEKSDKIDNRVLDMLAATLNNDENTNVRLAALNLMEKYSQDNHVSSLLVSSLNKQDDPMVQLGLISLLGKMKNIKIDDKLHSLANDPYTFTAVRDEAYTILLNQNKL